MSSDDQSALNLLIRHIGIRGFLITTVTVVLVISGVAHWAAKPGSEVTVLWGLARYTKDGAQPQAVDETRELSPILEKGVPKVAGFPDLSYVGNYLEVDTTVSEVTVTGPEEGIEYRWLPLAVCSAHATHTYTVGATGPTKALSLKLVRMANERERYGAPLMYRHVCERFLELQRSGTEFFGKRDFYIFTLLTSMS